MIPTFAFGMGAPQEWLIIAGLAVLFFGGAKLSQLGKGLGEGIREFKKSVNGEEESSTPPAPKSPASSADVPAEGVTSGK